MEHESDVGPVDAHAEGNGGHDDVDRLPRESLLRLVPLFGVESRMVGPRQNSLGREPGCQPFRLLPRDAVNDRGLARVPAEHLQRLGHAVGPGHDAVDEIGPIEDADQHLGLAELELVDDVVANAGRGGGGEGMDAG